MEALHILLDIAIGGRADDRRMNDQVFEIPAPGFLLELSHGRGFHIEDPHGLSPAEQFLGGRVINGIECGVVRGLSGMLPDCGQSIPNHGERPVSQQIDFNQTGHLRLVLFPLNHPHSLGRPLHGNIAGNPLRRQDGAAAMEGQMPGDGFQTCRPVKNFRPGGIQREPLKTGMLFHPLADPARVSPVAQTPGHLLDGGSGNTVDLGHFAHRRAGAKADMVGHRGHTLQAVMPAQFLQESIAFIPGEVHIDIR